MTETARLNAPRRLEIPQQDHRIGEIGNVDGRLHVPDNAVLSNSQKRVDSLPVQILQQLVHMEDQQFFFRHGGLVAVEAVDDDRFCVSGVDDCANEMRELAGRQLRGIHLLDHERAGLAHRFQIDAHFSIRSKSRPSSSSNTNIAAFSPRRTAVDEELDGERALAGACRPKDQRAGALFDPTAQKRVEFGDAGGGASSLEPRVVLGGDQPRKDGRPAGSYRKVVIAEADGSSAIFRNPKPPTFGAVVGRQLLQLNDAVDDAVRGLVRNLGSQIVKQQHGRAPTGEIMLDRQKLPPISQRALREKADLRQTVEDHPDRLRALKRREYRTGRLAELQIRRIEKALLLFGAQRSSQPEPARIFQRFRRWSSRAKRLRP